MTTKLLDREIGLKTEIVGRADGFEKTGSPGVGDPVVAGASTRAPARSLARRPVIIRINRGIHRGISLAISLATHFIRYLMSLNDSLSGPPLSQRERNRLAIGPWEKYSRYRIYQ
jgi:hypothetical protein